MSTAALERYFISSLFSKSEAETRGNAIIDSISFINEIARGWESSNSLRAAKNIVLMKTDKLTGEQLWLFTNNYMRIDIMTISY